MKNIEKIIAVLMLLFAVGFNLWLYRLEPLAAIDPNDNTFQFALVDRTNEIWDFAVKECSKKLITFPVCFPSYLVDHWVPNWAEGYNLPFYYSHVPQITIVTSYKILSPIISPYVSLFQYYHILIYLLLCLFPISIFLALQVVGVPWLTSGMGALLASQISTDGLYGLDPTSFLWRGYGLSSQLFAMVWLPLAIAYSWKYFVSDKQKLYPAVFFLIATTAGHLGIGIIAILSLIPFMLADPIIYLLQQSQFEAWRLLKINIKKLIILSGVTIFFLSYWVLPVLLGDNYHNISFWDPVWKFNSYGAKETIIRLLNGELFDFGRFPVYTLLTISGFFALLKNHQIKLRALSFLFLFWLLFYFGRTTWDGLIDLIPGMKEFHLSRFIVGLHLSGMFLAPIGLGWIVEEAAQKISSVIKKKHALIYVSLYVLSGALLIPIYQQTVKYNDLNNKLIVQANANYLKVKSDVDSLFRTIKSLPPARVFAGRGGGWGKDFKVAETEYFLHLSTYGVPIVLWLPETWSPNSDTEQYFSEDVFSNYNLYNIGYVAAPPNQAPQKFWKLLSEAPTWKLYSVKTDGYITSGIRPGVVSTDKRSYVNVVREWIQSDKTHTAGLYPELTFDKDYPKITGLPNFKMTNEVTYQVPDGSLHNLFQEPPVYMSPSTALSNVSILSQSEVADMIFKATVRVSRDCTECLVVLKQSFHPDWQATIDGKPVSPITVFPFFTAVPAGAEGTHEIIFSYQPSRLKILLMGIELAVLVFLLLDKLKKTRHSGYRL